MRTRHLLLAAGAAAIAALSLTSFGGAHGVKDGGTFMVAASGESFTSVDPILTSVAGPQIVLDATCAHLLRTQDKPLPAANRIVPEIAVGYPKLTNRGRTYTFTIKKGVRFNTGELVTAHDFAYTLNRVLNPAFNSPLRRLFQAIVGAPDVNAGKAKTASGVVVQGDRLIVRLTRPLGVFPALMASHAGCVLPSTLPPDLEGVKPPVPSAGPYYISEFVPGQRVVLERNPYYGGDRPHHVDRFVVDLAQDLATIADKVERGEFDYGHRTFGLSERAEELTRRFGINRSRFFVVPTGFVRFLILNTSRPLFRDNVRLRQAVNFAIDRKALLREWGPPPLTGTPTDQYLTPALRGFRNEHIYPLGAPDVATARALARGNTRSGKAVFYVPDFPFALAQAKIVTDNLKRIGLDVEVKRFPFLVMADKLGTPGEPFDIAWSGFGWFLADPSFPQLFADFSYFSSPKYDRLLERASRLPVGRERDQTWGRLDVDLARNAAIAVPYSYDTALTFVSARTGCVVANPYLDLAAVCLK